MILTHQYILNPQHPVTVTLIGCGGNGSQVLTQLARINHALKGLGHLGLYVTCYDDDIITESNLARQLFAESELGMNKSVALITRINRFFNTSWKAIPTKYESAEKPVGSNIIISCVDSIKARVEIEKTINSINSKNQVEYSPMYWMDIGNTQSSGQFILGTLRDNKSIPTLFEKFPGMKNQKEKDSGPSCSLAEALSKQDLFINSTLTQLAMGLLWKLFREGKINYHGAFINLNTLQIATIKI